jgi:hypothetical protein
MGRASRLSLRRDTSPARQPTDVDFRVVARHCSGCALATVRVAAA